MTDEITDDIERWSEKKLRQWVVDSTERYQMADLGEHEAFARTLTTLLMMLARAVSLTDAPATEAAERLGYAIDLIRRHNARERKAP